VNSVSTERGAVLVTGCSTGVGRATALRLHRTGWTVHATARKPESLAELADLGIRTVSLDLTDQASIAAAVDDVVARHGAVTALVNNAGYSLNGTIEETPMRAARAQFEANLFGPSELIRLVLPGMRERGRGRIVNVSSFFGRFGTAGRGYYQATKHGMEAISDALR
jgi:NAD(P)-dependent dehydrogenase (short-subunit alcohol dehydrogenase family)